MVFFFVAFMAALMYHNPEKAYHNLLLLFLCNAFFITASSFLVAFGCTWAFVHGSSLKMLVLGAGMFTFGFSSLLAGAMDNYGTNVSVSIHNCGAMAAGLMQAIAMCLNNSAVPYRIESRRLWCVITLGGLAAVLTAYAVLCVYGYGPKFYLPNQGSTALREWVLAAAALEFFGVAVYFKILHRRSLAKFARWYSLGLLLISAGLAGVLVGRFDSWLSWAGRAGQYISGVYMVIASAMLVQNRRGLTIAESVTAFFTDSQKTYAQLKIAVGQLAHSERQFRETFDNAPVGIAQIGISGRLLEVNAAYCNMLGYKRGELLTKTESQITHPDDLVFEELLVNELFSGKRSCYTIENRYMTGRGEYLWVRVTASMSANDEWSNDRHRICIVENISERKKTEESLKKTSESLDQEKSILNTVMNCTTNAHLVYLDRDFNFKYVNEIYASSCGCKASQMVGKNHFELFPHQENEAIFRHVRETGKPVEFHDKPFIFPDQPNRGVTYWDWALTPVKNHAGEIEGLVLSLIETTGRKRLESQRERAVERFKLLAETAGVLLSSQKPQEIIESLCTKMMHHLDCHVFFNFMADAENGNLKLNACAGIDADEAAKIKTLDYGVAVCGCVARDKKRIVASNIDTVYDPRTELVRSYGIKAYACHPILTQDSKLIGTLSFGTRSRIAFTDEELELMKAVSDQVAIAMGRIAAQHEIEKVNEELERKVADRTAVAEDRAVQLRALASDVTLAEQKERKRLAHILHDHLQQILAAAKLKTSLLKLELEDNLSSCAVADIIELLTQSIQCSRNLSAELSPPILHDGGLTRGLNWLSHWMEEKHGLEVIIKCAQPIENELPEDIKYFVFEGVREMLFNVVKHANVKRAWLEVKHSRDTLHVTVKDEGVGMDVKETVRRKEGFGLFSIRERIQCFGGELKLSSSKGMGTSIHMRIPVQLSMSKSENSRKKRPGEIVLKDTLWYGARKDKNKRLRVLIADDHTVIRHGLATMLQMQPDIEIVAHASDGQEAVDLAAEHEPDVAVIDVSMPNLSGVEATRLITSRSPHTKIVGLSMHAAQDMEKAMMQAGAVAYCTKDGPPESLLKAIRQAQSA